jgi:hypothetical protein
MRDRRGDGNLPIDDPGSISPPRRLVDPLIMVSGPAMEMNPEWRKVGGLPTSTA